MQYLIFKRQQTRKDTLSDIPLDQRTTECRLGNKNWLTLNSNLFITSMQSFYVLKQFYSIILTREEIYSFHFYIPFVYFSVII